MILLKLLYYPEQWREEASDADYYSILVKSRFTEV